MKRRGFLAGILAAGVAPAIVHNPMKIWVPKPRVWTSTFSESLSISRGDEDIVWRPEMRRVQMGRMVQDEFGETFFPTVVVPLNRDLQGNLIDLRVQPMFNHVIAIPMLAPMVQA